MFYGRQLPLCVYPCDDSTPGYIHGLTGGPDLSVSSGLPGEGGGRKQECDVTHAVPGQWATQFTGSQTGQSTAEVLMRLKQQQQQPGGMQDAGCGEKL